MKTYFIFTVVNNGDAREKTKTILNFFQKKSPISTDNKSQTKNNNVSDQFTSSGPSSTFKSSESSDIKQKSIVRSLQKWLNDNCLDTLRIII
jgi:hypothetical protein